jgi:uncharacterized protein YbjT (DUF2867 family)
MMKILIFGATGLAGGSVLRTCLASPDVDEVRVIGRRPVGLAHEKLREYLHDHYSNYARVREAFSGIDTCMFCLGISVMKVGSESEYRKITHDFAIIAAQTLKRESPSALFQYISGAGTRADSRMMWARVKAQTEQELMAMMPAVCWRPAFIHGEASAGRPGIFKLLRPLFMLLKPFRSLYVEGRELGWAMIQATLENIHGRVIENAEIKETAGRYGQRLLTDLQHDLSDMSR